MHLVGPVRKKPGDGATSDSNILPITRRIGNTLLAETASNSRADAAWERQSMSVDLRAIVRHRGVQATIALWVIGYLVVFWMARGSLPFDRPAVATLPFALQLAAPSITLIEILLLMGMVFLLTRRRVIPDIASRAPHRETALRETLLLIGYAAIGQLGGWILGPALGYRAFSFHIAGTVFGCSVPPQRGEMWTWALYNFVVFALLPYVYFRRLYTNTQLNLCSVDRRNDSLLIVAVIAVESAFELAVFIKTIFSLSVHQILIGAPLTLLLFFIGTVLPTMILIYAILLPRYLALSGSRITTALLGGLTYAAMHVVEGWSSFSSPTNATLSLIFVLLQYFGPGMFKSVLTLRTGNAWVHALSYHIIAPHVIVDTPLVVKTFGILP
jgi:hypothetical protein